MKILLLSSLLCFKVFAANCSDTREPEGACTPAMNEWGQARHCDCLGGYVYDERSGYCQAGYPSAANVTGHLMLNAMAVGQETTGIEVTVLSGDRYELILDMDTQARLIEEDDGRLVEVKGDLIFAPGLVREPRPSIIVNELNFL